MLVAKGHEFYDAFHSDQASMLGARNWTEDNPAPHSGYARTFRKSGRSGKVVVLHIVCPGVQGNTVHDFLASDVIRHIMQDSTFFCTVGCCGGFPGLPLTTAVPIVAAHLENSSSTLDVKVLPTEVDNIKDDYAEASR